MYANPQGIPLPPASTRSRNPQSRTGIRSAAGAFVIDLLKLFPCRSIVLSLKPNTALYRGDLHRILPGSLVAAVAVRPVLSRSSPVPRVLEPPLKLGPESVFRLQLGCFRFPVVVTVVPTGSQPFPTVCIILYKQRYRLAQTRRKTLVRVSFFELPWD